MLPLRVINIYPETIVDGEGLRFSIYFSGCFHKCAGCQNPETWEYAQGTVLDEEFEERIFEQINENTLLSGVTLSGGDPFYNPEALLAFLKKLKKRTKANVWCYTGFVYEALVKDALRKPCLKYIDVLVDGPFIAALKDEQLRFRGSSNQRVIDVPASLATGRVVLVEGM